MPGESAARGGAARDLAAGAVELLGELHAPRLPGRGAHGRDAAGPSDAAPRPLERQRRRAAAEDRGGAGPGSLLS